MPGWQNPAVSDWTITAASAATAAGTLILAVATFSSVRSAQRAARATEAALLAGIRPVLVASHLEDASQKVRFLDDHWAHVEGGRATVEVTDDAVYLLVSLRNVGNGLTLDILYGDHQGGQRTISRFVLTPVSDGRWLAAVGRHWNLDRPDPR